MRLTRMIVTVVLLGLTSSIYAEDRIYLLAGQSNMMGKGKISELPASYRQTPANVKFYYQGREKGLAQFAYFGPEIGFAHEVARAFPNDQHIIIKQAATGSTIERWLPGQALYKGLLRQVGFSLPEDHDKKIDAIVWMQGESDARSANLAGQYGGRLNRLIQALRNDLNSPNSLFILGQINPEDLAFSKVAQVQASQRQAQQASSNTILVSTDGLGKMYDHVHYNANGQLELGKRFAKAYIEQARKRGQLASR